jgi:hypothetical protein
VSIIADLLWLWILGAIGGSAYIVWAVYLRGPTPATAHAPSPSQAATTRKTVPPAAMPARPAPPVARPTTQGGSPEHQRRAAAPTVKVAGAEAPKPQAKPSSDDQAMADLFSGVEKKPEPGKEQTKDHLDKASRIEEMGFHPGSKPQEGTGRIAAEPAPAAAKPEVPAAPRSQTAELDDILKRIDAVLADGSAPAAEATLVEPSKQPQEATLPVAQPPPKETDGGQQKLF